MTQPTSDKRKHESHCCHAPVKVVGDSFGDGTMHWECEKCGESCNDLYYYHDEIAKAPVSTEKEPSTPDIIEEGVEPLVRDFCSVVPMSKSEARERLRSFAQRILEAARDEEAIRCHVHSEEAFEAGKKEGAGETLKGLKDEARMIRAKEDSDIVEKMVDDFAIIRGLTLDN